MYCTVPRRGKYSKYSKTSPITYHLSTNDQKCGTIKTKIQGERCPQDLRRNLSRHLNAISTPIKNNSCLLPHLLPTYAHTSLLSNEQETIGISPSLTHSKSNNLAASLKLESNRPPNHECENWIRELISSIERE